MDLVFTVSFKTFTETPLAHLGRNWSLALCAVSRHRHFPTVDTKYVSASGYTKKIHLIGPCTMSPSSCGCRRWSACSQRTSTFPEPSLVPSTLACFIAQHHSPTDLRPPRPPSEPPLPPTTAYLVTYENELTSISRDWLAFSPHLVFLAVALGSHHRLPYTSRKPRSPHHAHNSRPQPRLVRHDAVLRRDRP